MFQNNIIQAFTGSLLLSAGMMFAQETPLEKVERENRHLRLQIEKLNQTLAATLEREATKTQSLREIREHLSLFGKDFFEGGDTKLRHAVSDYQIARENLERVEFAVSDLIPSIKSYLRTAIAADPDARAEVEVKLRELEVALGQRQKPVRRIDQGTAQEARVVTVDSETGVLVINAGSEAELAVGMRFRIERSGAEIGDATLASIRPHVSGLLMQNLKNPETPVQAGDLAKIILNSDPTNR